MQTLRLCCGQRVPNRMLRTKTAPFKSYDILHRIDRRTRCHHRDPPAGAAQQSTRWSSSQALSVAASDEDSRRFRFAVKKRDGSTGTISILPTPKARLDVLKGLIEELNSGNAGYPHRWYLDENGDAIHAQRLGQPFDTDRVLLGIDREADSMRHHPHVSRKEVFIGSEQVSEWDLITVTCATHRPHGLGVRDFRLARRIDEVFDRLDFRETAPVEYAAGTTDKLEEIYQVHVAEHRKAMDAASR